VNKEDYKAAHLIAVNTVVAELNPWIEARILRGQSNNQILNELRQHLAGPVAPPAPVDLTAAHARFLEKSEKTIAEMTANHTLLYKTLVTQAAQYVPPPRLPSSSSSQESAIPHAADETTS
jgi:acetylornithine deacetylase/succinyl-diaminopimelate desuccinylase-like protein